MAEMKEYKLKGTNTQEARRNFPGFEKNVWYTLDELRSGDYAGMTETDSKTSGKEDGKYTPINKKSGKGGRAWKSSSPRTNEN